MQATRIEKIAALRDEAWREVQATSAYAVVKALDEALAALGGSRLLPVSEKVIVTDKVEADIRRSRDRPSQADAAEAALRLFNEPLPVGRLLEAALAAGAKIGGGNPLANFRSTLSKDSRFYSFTRNGMFFWWLDGVRVPPEWNEAPDLPLVNGSSASASSSSKEGGDGHAATLAH